MKHPTQAEVTREFIDAIGKAANACGVLTHVHGNINWMSLRTILEGVKEAITEEALQAYEKPKMGLLRPA